MVVIVLVFILAIGLVVYFQFVSGSVETEIALREDANTVLLGKRVKALPEVQCDRFAGTSCVDLLKFEALAAEMPDNDYYRDLFGFANISLHGVTDEQVITLYNTTPSSAFNIRPQFSFTTVYNPLTRTYQLAYLNITRFEVLS